MITSACDKISLTGSSFELMLDAENEQKCPTKFVSEDNVKPIFDGKEFYPLCILSNTYKRKSNLCWNTCKRDHFE